MIVQELVTNAVKHGTLSTPDGKVTLQWRIESRFGEDWLVCRWMEQGGPPGAQPGRQGFGLSLIERSMRYELKANAVMEWLPDGVSATLAMPLARVGARTSMAGEGK